MHFKLHKMTKFLIKQTNTQYFLYNFLKTKCKMVYKSDLGFKSVSYPNLDLRSWIHIRLRPLGSKNR